MKNLFTDIKDRLQELSSLQTVSLWNRQFERSNNDDSNLNTEESFAYPCAFIHFFGDNPPSSGGGGAKRLDVDVRIYIGIHSYEKEETEIFDLADEVRTQLENWHTDNMTGLIYQAQRFNYDYDNVRVYEIDFRTQYTDDSKWFKKTTVTMSGLATLDLNVDLDVDNNIVRTGDGS